MSTDEELIVTCLTPEIHKLNEKLKNENRTSATEAEFLNAVETAMRNIIKAARAEGYKQGQIDAITHLFENKIAMVRAVKVLSEEMQDVAKKAGYKPDDILFITMEKIEGGMVIKGSVAKCESDELVIKKVD